MAVENYNVDITETITHLSLCSGYDGIGLGLKRVWPNVRDVAHVEIEAFAAANLVAKMEAGELDTAPVWTNLKTFPAWRFRGCVDILSAGFPCQPFSCAGARAADDDPRHLWPHVRQAVGLIRPRMVMLENVEGIISSKLKGGGWNDPEGTPVLLHVLRELERTGYKCTWGVFSASEVGASHQRKRVFILGYTSDKRCEQDTALRSVQQTGWINEVGRKSRGEELANSEGLPRWCMPQRTQEEFTQFGSSSMADTNSIHRSTPPERWKHDRKAGPAGEELADPQNQRHERGETRGNSRGENWIDQREQRETSGCPVKRGGSEGLEDTNSSRGDKSMQLDTNLPAKSSRCYREEGEELADPSEPGSQRNISDTTEEGWQDAGRPVAGCCEYQWPARPGEEQYEWEEPRTIEPGLGGTVDGFASRVDRLRLLGNGVVPQTAERAVRVLLQKLLS